MTALVSAQVAALEAHKATVDLLLTLGHDEDVMRMEQRVEAKLGAPTHSEVEAFTEYMDDQLFNGKPGTMHMALWRCTNRQAEIDRLIDTAKAHAFALDRDRIGFNERVMAIVGERAYQKAMALSADEESE